jgi:transforming growth factor-beta-induced protein
MKRLSWLPIVMLAAQPLFGCSDDESDDGETAGTGGTGSGGGNGKGGTGGAPSSAPKDIVDTAVQAGSFNRLAGALEAAGLVSALKGAGPFTVFAPTDAAFDAFEAANPGVLGGLGKDELTAILTYHVLSGAAVRSSALKDGQVVTTLNGSPALIRTNGGGAIADARVTTADVVASNGVIHVIDRIILPPANDIVATAIAAGSFDTLASALTEAGLVDELQGKGPFTVFAPTDAAFAELSAVPDGDALRDVLLYHVVSGAVGSGDLATGSVPTLLSGESLAVSLSGGVGIDAASVTQANIITKNGVIHVVDSVLIPD